ncbi:magnesium/cobalt transporter CorA [Desulforegula conservatrix]|uniref:magnesium/cobalt transporter CorA n=1 Tax=Desulforegula conservatrix TaxID=153026 RepID=UPI000405E953|nr:magnesium/cobalt transporter CorA [Desulforegula conservatrix]
MSRNRKSQRTKAGLPPGSLIHIGEKLVEYVSINLIDYTENSFTERKVESIEDCREALVTPSISWINMVGLHDVTQFQQIQDVFGIHPLVLEDILSTAQRPRMEDYGDYIYIVLKMIYLEPESHQIISEQISLILGKDFLLSFQESTGNTFNPIRDRIRTSKGRLRKSGADYLAYCMLDAIVDNYFVVLEEIGEKIEDFQEQVIGNPSPEVLSSIHRAKRDMIHLRKALWPVRELVNGLQKTESSLIEESTDVFLRDVYEHSVQVIESIEMMRDMLGSALDIYLSSTSNRMNEVMRVLTVISTLFIPLTFMVGIYGMNFENMPELKLKYGYEGLWVIMILTVAVMITFFRKRKWF